MTTVNEQEIEETKAIIESLDEYTSTNMPDTLLDRTSSAPSLLLRTLIKVLVSKNLLTNKDVRVILGLTK